MNITIFFKKWKEGILTLSPEKQSKAKLTGIVGGIIGLTLALISLFYRKSWGFSIFVFFIIWLQVISYISTHQQYIQLKEISKELETKEEDINSSKINNEIGNV